MGEARKAETARPLQGLKRKRTAPKDHSIRCSFCRKGQGEVEGMFCPDGMHICADCVDVFAAELAKRRSGD